MIHILLVDDDPLVLKVTGLVLRKAGYAVTTASSGGAALDALAAGEACDMVITDYAMPEMSGTELIATLLRQHPELPALVISGYAAAKEWPDLPDRVALLRKPFSRDDILAWIAAQACVAASS